MSADAARIAALALAEDGDTDVTTTVTVPPGLQAEGVIEFRSGGVLASAAYADAVARACDCRVEWRAGDGRAVRPGAPVGLVSLLQQFLLQFQQDAVELVVRVFGALVFHGLRKVA